MKKINKAQVNYYPDQGVLEENIIQNYILFPYPYIEIF